MKRKTFVQGALFGTLTVSAVYVLATYLILSYRMHRSRIIDLEERLAVLNTLYGPPSSGHYIKGLQTLDRAALYLELTGDGMDECLVLFGRGPKWGGRPPPLTLGDLKKGTTYCTGFAIFQRCVNEWVCAVLYFYSYDMSLTLDQGARLTLYCVERGYRNEWRWQDGEPPEGKGWRRIISKWDGQGGWSPVKRNAPLYVATYAK